jgi:CHAD domain-containing protein
MRAAMEAFRDLIETGLWERVYGKVKFVTKTLGSAREAEVVAQLAAEVAGGGDEAENLCREYLEERLKRKLDRHRRRMRADLSSLDMRQFRREFRELLRSFPAAGGSGARDDDASPPASTPPPDGPPDESLPSLAAPILSFTVKRSFRRASDQRLHVLRIAVKRFRYALELFDPAWPGGLQKEVELARLVQQAAGTHQDWTVLRDSVRREIRRLTTHETSHLTFQLGRLLARVEARKLAARGDILAPLVELQSAIGALLSENPPAGGAGQLEQKRES